MVIFWLLVIVPLFLAGALLLVLGFKQDSRLVSWLLMGFGGVLMIPPIGLLVLVIIVDVIWPHVEWNPVVHDADVIGTFAEGDDRVTFTADRTFSYRLSSQTGRGTWTRHIDDDYWVVYLSGDTAVGSMHLIRESDEHFQGALHLIPRPIVPLNGWDRDLGLPKVE